MDRHRCASLNLNSSSARNILKPAMWMTGKGRWRRRLVGTFAVSIRLVILVSHARAALHPTAAVPCCCCVPTPPAAPCELSAPCPSLRLTVLRIIASWPHGIFSDAEKGRKMLRCKACRTQGKKLLLPSLLNCYRHLIFR